jgi:hypothetical protein
VALDACGHAPVEIAVEISRHLDAHLAAAPAMLLHLTNTNFDDEVLRSEVPPFVVLYEDGRPAAHIVGARPKAALEHALGLDVAA